MPDELFVSNISTAAPPPAETAPTALLTPTLDGEETSYFEWLGAGALEVRDLGGAMHQIDVNRRSSILTLVQFGFAPTRDRLYVRLDSDRRLADLLADGYAFSLKFLQPAGVRFVVQMTMGQVGGTFWVRTPGSPGGPGGADWTERGPGASSAAAGTILELSVALADLGCGQQDAEARIAFFVVASGPDRSEVESHPAHHPIEVRVPDEQFEARHWTA